MSSGANSGYVLTSDATGNATWQAALSGWGLNGNSGTTPGTNFIGTTDDNDLVFKRNNIEGFRLSGASGSIVTTVDATINGVTIGMGGGNIETNTVIGSGAMISNTTGYSNTAIGLYALNANTDGDSNIAIGESSLASNTTGYSNTAIGIHTLIQNSTGTSNIAIGYDTLYSNISGN